MRSRLLVTVAIVSLATQSSFAAAAQIGSSPEGRIQNLQMRMAELLPRLRAADNQLVGSALRLGENRLRRAEASAQLARARSRLQARAAEAYKRGLQLPKLSLLQARSLEELLTMDRYLEDTIGKDRRALDSLKAALRAAEDVAQVRDDDYLKWTRASRDLSSLRKELTSALAEERRLAAAVASRPRSRVSAGVEARRSARQKVLDQQLQALLDWYAPASGAEPFMPASLKGSSVVSFGLSSWYGPGFHGRRASSGATFDANQATAASRVLPFGTLLKVTFRAKTVVVVITDRGPYVRGRVLDLSRAAAQAIGLTGVQTVRMEILLPTQPAPPFP